MKNLIMIMAVLLFTGTAFAQADREDNDRIKSVKIAFITDKLDLTSKEATSFWPVYNEFDEQLRKLRMKQKDNSRAFSAKQGVSDSESDKFINDQLALRQSECDLMKKYVAEFRKILPVAKVARLLTLEHEFKQQLLKRIRDRRPDRPDPGR